MTERPLFEPPIDPVEGEVEEICPSACRALWIGVLNQQFELLARPSSADKDHEIRQARLWFGSRDFYMVCALAGLDAEGRTALWDSIAQALNAFEGTTGQTALVVFTDGTDRAARVSDEDMQTAVDETPYEVFAIGLGAAYYLSRLIVALLYNTNPLDPVVFAGGAVVLLLVAMMALLVPASRASRIEPMGVLKQG